MSNSEKLYAHYIAKASWAGTPALTSTLSYESPDLVQLWLNLFKHGKLDVLKEKVPDAAAWDRTIEYAVQVLYNLGNYKSFGDTKVEKKEFI